MSKPYRIQNWTYFTVLTFISLTSFPAIFYAIPVERYVSIEIANKINVWFLAVVAAWRLILLFYFIMVFTRMNIIYVLTITLLPMTVIITTLTILNLQRVVFNVMGGIRTPTAHDSAYTVLVFLTMASTIAVIPILLVYLFGIFQSWRKRRNEENS